MANGLIQPVYQPNIAQLLMQSIGAAQQFGQLQKGMQAGQQRQEIAGLAGQAQTDPAALQRLAALDPAKARQIQLMQTEADERFRKERAFTSGLIENLPLDRQISTLDERINMLTKRGGDPSNTQGLRDMLASGDPAQIANAQEVIRAARVQGEREGFLKPAQKALKPTSLMQNLQAAGFEPGSEEYKRVALASIMGPQQRIQVGADGQISIVSGRGVKGEAALQKPVIRDLEKKLVRAEENIGELNRIESQFKPDYLTYLGRGKAFVSGIKSKAGAKLTPQEKQFLGGRRRFTENINRFFNQYRKDITGAAASVQELASLKKAMFSEDLSPAEFEASFNEFKQGVLRSQRLSRKLLREGVRGNFKNKKSHAAKQLDQRFLSGEDDSVLDRIEELKGAKSEDEIFEILQREGYSLNP